MPRRRMTTWLSASADYKPWDGGGPAQVVGELDDFVALPCELRIDVRGIVGA